MAHDLPIALKESSADHKSSILCVFFVCDKLSIRNWIAAYILTVTVELSTTRYFHTNHMTRKVIIDWNKKEVVHVD